MTPRSSFDIVIVGAGFAGMYMLYAARQLGLKAICAEAAPSVGGTWYHNRYPGARVDIESLEYSFSFSEELQQDWTWSERYSAQAELLRYANHVADRFDLRRDIRLDTMVNTAVWNEPAKSWDIDTAQGDHWRAKFLVLATGILSKPNTPAFNGLEKFAGRVLHTADWPHEGIDMSGLCVGVIGTGSTGVQVIPRLARSAKELIVFQRTAAWAVPSHNAPMRPEIEAAIKADYAGFRAQNRKMMGAYGSALPPNMVSALDATPDERQRQFEERWAIGGVFIGGAFYDLTLNPDSAVHVEEFIKSKIRAIVKDPHTARLLSPNFRFWCKRLCVDSDSYYDTYNLPHVKLVDVAIDPVSHFTKNGPVVGGKEYPLDVVVMATGFDAVTGAIMRMDIRGRKALPIQDKWAEGPMNYLGMTVSGFPNMFFTAGAGSATAFTNVIMSIEHHVEYIAALINWMKSNGHVAIEAEERAEADWMDHVQAMAEKTTRLSCNSWYLGANIPGKPRRFMPLSGGFPAYVQRCEAVAAANYAGFSLLS